MSETSTIVLVTGLFEDAVSLKSALANADGVKWIDLDWNTMKEQDWDEVVRQLLSTKKVITL